MQACPTLETPRLLLRPFTVADAPEVHRLAGEREVASTTLHIPHPYEEGMAEHWIGTHQEQYARGEGVHFAIVSGILKRYSNRQGQLVV
jgi:RimJ/RimL family protein N-acetyltransferase